MSVRQFSGVAFGLATAMATSGCCGGEQHSVRISAPDLLTVNVGSNTLLMYSNGSLTSPPISSSTLQFLFNTLEGSASGEGIVLSVRGNEATSSQAMMLSLALPVALRNGDVYTVGPTFTNYPGPEGEAAAFGSYDLVQPNQAEVALNVSTYTFPPATFAVSYRATNTSGTIQVTNRQRDQVELTLDLSFTDANGTPATVTGRVLAVNERTSARCN